MITKYYPPNFDPKNLSTVKKGYFILIRPGKHRKVRLMAPFSMQCKTCGEFIYKGKKFNARKESSHGETYLGIQIWRFYITCPVCISEITFKTDPENTDYICEHGATRNYEPWRDETRAHFELKEDRLKMEEFNAMLALENKTLDSKIELDVLDALDELKTKNAILSKINPDDVAEKLSKNVPNSKAPLESIYEEEDEKLARSIFIDINGENVKRLVDEGAAPPKLTDVGSENFFGNLKPKIELGIKRKSVKTDNNEKKMRIDFGSSFKCEYPESDSD